MGIITTEDTVLLNHDVDDDLLHNCNHNCLLLFELGCCLKMTRACELNPENKPKVLVDNMLRK